MAVVVGQLDAGQLGQLGQICGATRGLMAVGGWERWCGVRKELPKGLD